MSPKVKTYYLIVFVICGILSAKAQNFNEQGLMSGSGIVFTPTTVIAPSSQFRIQVGRLNYLRKNLRGFNVFELNGGLSPNLEAYAKLYSEQIGTISSTSSFGIGGKLLLPFSLPIIGHLAIWTESVSSPQSDSAVLLQQNIIRSGIITGFKLWNLQPTLFAGVNKVQNHIKPIGGMGVLSPISNAVKIGGEFFYNYFGRKDIQGLFTGSVRVFSNMSVQISSGYISSKEFSSWMITAGLSLATADLDFNPKAPPAPSMNVPSIEEMERLSLQEKGIGQAFTDPTKDGTVKKEEKQPEQQQDNKQEKPKK